MDITISFSENFQSALMTIDRKDDETSPPVTVEDLRQALAAHNVVAGIREETLAEIINSSLFNQSVVVASWQPPGAGTNARVEILKKPRRIQELVPGQKDSGEVDYAAPREGFLVYARKGDILAIKYPATRGESGRNVLGREIPGKIGQDINLEHFCGSGTAVEENRLLARRDGMVSLDGVKVGIFDSYIIDDNIGISTGSIDLPLDLDVEIIVNGDIQRGYHAACHKLSVTGCVEDAKITSEILRIKGGIVGTGDDPVMADRIEVGYINGTRKIRGNTIVVGREISSGAEVYGKVIRAYTIRGSTVAAMDALWADYINGKNSIIIGIDYQMKLQYDELSGRIASLHDPIEELRSEGLINAKKMKKLSELAKINPKHPLLRQELPKIREATVRLDNYLNLRADLIKKREEIAAGMYSQKSPFLLVQMGFSRDSNSGTNIEPNVLILIREHLMKITESIRGGLFTADSSGIKYSINYNIKQLQGAFQQLGQEKVRDVLDAVPAQ